MEAVADGFSLLLRVVLLILLEHAKNNDTGVGIRNAELVAVMGDGLKYLQFICLPLDRK